MGARSPPAGNDGTVQLWDVATHRQLGSLRTANTEPVYERRVQLRWAHARRRQP